MASTSTAAVASSASADAGAGRRAPAGATPRQRALESHLGAVREAASAETDPATQPAPAGGLDPWTARRVQAFFRQPDGDGDAEATVTAHALALRRKCEVDLERLAGLGGRSGRELFASQAELMLDAAMGSALVRETQQAIQQAVARVDHEAARALNRLHHGLRRDLERVRASIDASERDRSEALAAQMALAPLAPAPPPSGAPVAAPAARPPRADRREQWRRVLRTRPQRRAATAWFPNRTELLVAALALSALVWAAADRLPALRAAGPPALSVADLPASEAIAAVDARPPSLFVTVNDAAWERLDREARLRLAERVSAPLVEHGYRGALLATSSGRPVARWLRASGPALIEEGESRPDAGPRSGAPTLQLVLDGGGRGRSTSFRLRPAPRPPEPGGGLPPTGTE